MSKLGFRQQLLDIFNKLQKNEKLMRLLYYTPKNALDDPLAENKQNVTEFDDEKFQKIIKNSLIPSDKKFDLDVDNSELCRICMYNGDRIPQSYRSQSTHLYSKNNQVATQYMVFDVYVHLNIDIVDLRLSWICDVLDQLLVNEEITGISKFEFIQSAPITNTPDGYCGYRMIYTLLTLQEHDKV